MTSQLAPRPAHLPPVIPKRRKKKRSANNVNLKSASPEVISNLLASFSAITLPEEPEHDPSSLPPRTPPRTARSSSLYNSQRIAHLQSKASREASFDIPDDARPYGNYGAFVTLPEEEEDDDDDAAEAPVIHTSRPTAGGRPTQRRAALASRSQSAARNVQRSGYSTTGAATPQHDESNIMTRLASLTSLTRERVSGFASPTTLSGRPSFDARRNDSARTASLTGATLPPRKSSLDTSNQHARPPGTAESRASDNKGKSRAQVVPSVQASSNHSSRPQSSSQRHYSSSLARAGGNSRMPPADAVGDDTGFIIRHPPKSSPTAYTFSERSRSLQGDGPPNIPSRTGSLLGVSHPKLPVTPDRQHAGGTSAVADKRLGTDKAVPKEAAQSPSSSAETVFLDSKLDDRSRVDKLEEQKVAVDLDDDNEVTRRIKELRAANERRRKDYATVDGEQTARAPTDGPSQIPGSLMRNTPSQGYARAQDQHLLAQSQLGKNGAMIGLPAPDLLLPPDSLSQQTLSHSSRSSQVSPAISRSSSRSVRWPASELAKNAASPERSHQRMSSRDSNRLQQYPPLLEEGRTSAESIAQEVDSFLASSKLSRKIPALEDLHRQVAFSDVGDPQGHVVFCCLGMGLTRYVTAYYEELAQSLGLRLITPDRPGVGDSTAYRDNRSTPLNWPDDVRAICRYLGIEEFSILAHSAGAIYALATALRMPHRIKGNIHLLAPWIPPSQMTNIGIPSASNSPSSIPRSQRFLRLLPTSLLKLSNSSFLSSRNVVGGRPKSSKSRKSSDTRQDSQFTSPRPSVGGRYNAFHTAPQTASHSLFSSARQSGRTSFEYRQNSQPLDDIVEVPSDHSMATAIMDASFPSTQQQPSGANETMTRQQRFDQALIPAVWTLATRKANPAVDLLVCLERHHKIGFRYADISQPVIIHHGNKDTRIPLENVKWIAKTMQHAEVRVLDGQGHGLMASASVISAVLVELAKEVEPKDASAVQEPLFEVSFR